MSPRRTRAIAPHETSASRPPRSLVGLEEAGDTPILRQYRAVKAEYPDAIVLARLGDFYECFGEDAERAAPVLGVALTGRSFGSGGRLPMCGVPHHAATQYLRRLLDAGMRVVLWDQVEEGGAPQGPVRRRVTRVLGPGTVLDDTLLDPVSVARCVALAPADGQVGIAALDAGAAELELSQVCGDLGSPAVADELARLAAAELVLPEGVQAPPTLAPRATRARLVAPLFDPRRGAERVREALGVATLRGLGVEDLPIALGAAGALLAYAERVRLQWGRGVLRVRRRSPGEVVPLDAATRRNLELLGATSGAGPGLVQLLDRTRTPMGARLLRTRLMQPLGDPAPITARLDAVAALVADTPRRTQLAEALAAAGDLERAVARCLVGSASPRDLARVRDALGVLPRVRAVVEPLDAEELLEAAAACRGDPQLLDRLWQMLVDDPPATAREGGCIRAGADEVLDRLHADATESREWIARLEQRERERTGIRSLRVGYNRVFGYYIEVSNAHRGAVPPEYVRKQTLTGAERYVTPELREREAVVLGAKERAIARESELLADLTRAIASQARPLLDLAAGLARLDVAQSLATVADELGWCRPQVDASLRLEIAGGRHPLVERSLPAGRFVANDCLLDAADHPPDGAARILVLTGPNMAGKSTYLRQVATCVLLAQVGSFVPAERATVGVCDRIFTRVGAQDELAAGLSTFMVEMTETAAILNQATRRSLVVLDEIGRGTSTYDGMSIAQAVLEYLHDAPHLGCRTLFATHFHELTALAGRLPRVANARVEVLEEGDSVTFLHRIVPGGADRSYGIHVARLAGVPRGVVERARRLVAELEEQRPLGPQPAPPSQLPLPLPATVPHPVVAELEHLDLDALTPLAALNKLAEWQRRVVTAPSGSTA